MEVKDITLYLQEAFELEASLDRQSRAIDEAYEVLDANYPQIPDIKKPEKQEVERLDTKTIENDKEAIICRSNAVILIGAGVLLFIIIFFVSLAHDILGLNLIGLFFSVPLLLWGRKYLRALDERKMAIKNYNLDIQEKYEQDVSRYERKYEQELKDYHAKIETAQKEFEEREKGYARGLEAVKKLEVSCSETREILEQLYDANVVFPKYRNLVAMSSMYEYLASGRCSQLTGPDGAYNLFEFELRQNIIIGELGIIIEQLEDIKRGQYMLYTELQKTNQILSDISSDIEKLVETGQEISEATNIAAFCSQVTMKNTEALKYITLVNG